MPDSPGPSRRTLFRDVAAGGIASAVAAGLPGTAHAAPADPGPGLTNPLDRFPKPPFPVQSQPWPGLQSRMTPVPDCGETSYKGPAAWPAAAR